MVSSRWTLRCWPIAEVVARTGVGASTLRRWASQGRVRSYRRGKVIYLNLDDACRRAGRMDGRLAD